MRFLGPSLLIIAPTLVTGVSYDRQWGNGFTFALGALAIFAWVGGLIWIVVVATPKGQEQP